MHSSLVEQPPRTKPLALINLGLPRTGTKSLRKALQILGFENVYHYDTILPNEHPEHCHAWNEAFRLKYTPGSTLTWSAAEWDAKILSTYTSLSDNPCVSFAPELLRAYPDAKVLLSVRDSAAVWTKSYSETILPVEEAFHNATWNPVRLVYRWYIKARSPIVAMVDQLTMYGPTRRFRERGGERIYDGWNAEVSEACEGRKAGFLEFNVKQGWGPLCAFLGVEVPEVPFPRLNDKQEFLELWQIKEKDHYEVVDWRVWAGAGLGAMVPLVAGYLLTKDGFLKAE